MKFRTEIKIEDAPQNLSAERLVALVGSCFSDNIGERISRCGWPAVVNPCGVVYNPVSMAVLFRLAISHPALRRDIVASSITEREGKYVSWFTSSKCVGNTPDECVDNVLEALDELQRGIVTGDAVILTFGTSDVWLLKDTDRAVGNCHKHPTSEFERRRAGVDDITETWRSLITDARNLNPGLKVILTVSPRRYLSSGFADNSCQKAVLLLACEKLCKELEDVYYFPAYEILNDDLRDYRFYASDMLHPSEAAVDYVWEHFCNTFLDSRERAKLKEREKMGRRLGHRPII